MNKHTPGPWAVSDDGDVTLIVHAPKDEVDIACMSNDCEMFSEIRANANLIAAAPAMYEALVEMVELRKQLAIDHPHLFVGKAVLLRAEAALAQAEGSKP